MTLHTYPNAAMLADYLRAAAGFVPTAAILATARVGATAAALLTGLAALFLLFGIRTALRHGTQVEMTETGLRATGPLRAVIAWAGLDSMKLAYYSTHRDRRDGWMQLTLRAGRSVMRFDSRIDGFAELVTRATRAARARGVDLDPATAANLEALGIASPVVAFGLSQPGRGAA